MNIEIKKNIALAISIIFLAISFSYSPASLTFGFFRLLRVILFVSMIYVSWLAFLNGKNDWIFIFGTIAVLFNPFIPFSFGEEIWKIVDLVLVIFFVISFFIFTFNDKKKIQTKLIIIYLVVIALACTYVPWIYKYKDYKFKKYSVIEKTVLVYKNKYSLIFSPPHKSATLNRGSILIAIIGITAIFGLVAFLFFISTKNKRKAEEGNVDMVGQDY